MALGSAKGWRDAPSDAPEFLSGSCLIFWSEKQTGLPLIGTQVWEEPVGWQPTTLSKTTTQLPRCHVPRAPGFFLHLPNSETQNPHHCLDRMFCWSHGHGVLSSNGPKSTLHPVPMGHRPEHINRKSDIGDWHHWLA